MSVNMPYIEPFGMWLFSACFRHFFCVWPFCGKETLKDKRETWSGQMYVSVCLVVCLVGWFGLFFFQIMVYFSYHGIIDIIIWNRCMAGGILRTAKFWWWTLGRFILYYEFCIWRLYSTHGRHGSQKIVWHPTLQNVCSSKQMGVCHCLSI